MAADSYLAPYRALGTFSALGIVGSFAGNAVSTKLPQQTLRKAFAYFLFAVGAFIVLKSWPGLMGGTPGPGAGGQ